MQYLPRSSRFRSRRKGVNFKKLGTIIALAVFLIAALAFVRYYSLYAALKEPAVPAVWRPEGGRVQILLAGRHNNKITACTVLSISAEEGVPVSILRLPAATLLGGLAAADSLAEVYGQMGIEKMIEGVDGLLAGRLPISHYLVYDVQGLAEIVTALEPVKINLPEKFQVRAGDTDYIFGPGDREITGGDIVPLIASDTDFLAASFWAEKSLLVQVVNQLFSFNHISYYVRNMGAVSDAYETDLEPRQLARLRDTLQALEWEDRRYSVLPGRWLVSEDQRFWAGDEGMIEMSLRQIIENIPSYDKAALKVDIFNGNGISGFAGKTADRLRERGYNVGQVGNADTTQVTQVYYQQEYLLAAIEISLLLDTEAVLIQDRYYDSNNPVSVVLGLDLAGR